MNDATLQKFILMLFSGQNIGMKLANNSEGDYSSFLSHFDCRKHNNSSSCICLVELKMLLNYFIQKLKNTKRISISIKEKTSNLETFIESYGKSVVSLTEFSSGNEGTGRNIYVTIGPYSQTLTPG